MRNFILFSLLALSPFVTPASAPAKDREVTVSGHCSRMVTPDRASITLASEFVDKDLTAAIGKATEAYNRVREDVKKLGLENLELKTVEYQVGEQREWENNKNVFKGYRARMGLKVATSDIARMGEVIAAAAKEGLQDVGRLTSFLSDERNRKEQFACLHDAAEDARARAHELATSLNARLGDVVSLTETEARQGGPILPLEEPTMLKARANIAPPAVDAGQQQITVDIQAVFGLQ